MITVSKGLSPPVLAQRWMNDLGARPDMSIKVGFLSHDMRIAGRIVGVQSTEQSVGIIVGTFEPNCTYRHNSFAISSLVEPIGILWTPARSFV